MEDICHEQKLPYKYRISDFQYSTWLLQSQFLSLANVCREKIPAHCRMFRSIPGLYPLDIQISGYLMSYSPRPNQNQSRYHQMSGEHWAVLLLKIDDCQRCGFISGVHALSIRKVRCEPRGMTKFSPRVQWTLRLRENTVIQHQQGSRQEIPGVKKDICHILGLCRKIVCQKF